MPWRSRFIGVLRGATDEESQQPRCGLAIDRVTGWTPINEPTQDDQETLVQTLEDCAPVIVTGVPSIWTPGGWLCWSASRDSAPIDGGPCSTPYV